MAPLLASLPTEILFLIIFCVDNAKDLRSLSSTNHLFRTLAGPHTVTAQLWFAKHSRDIPLEDHLETANKWRFPLKTEYAKKLITINAPPEPPGISRELPGPKRALKRQERVLHIVKRFSLFLHNMLAVNYYYTHDWDSLQKVADSVECYLEDLGWVQFYLGQMNGIDSMMVSTVQADQEFEEKAFDEFTKKLKTDISAISSITTSSSSKNTNTNNESSNNRNDRPFALSPEPVYLRWTSLIQDQLNFFCLQQYIMDKFKPPSKLQLTEYLSVVLFENI